MKDPASRYTEIAGRFLIDLWQQGQRDNGVELARQMGCEGLDLEPLTEELLNF